MKPANDNQLIANLRALPRGVWILFVGTFLNKFGTFVLPFLAIYLTGMGFTSAQAGIAIGAYGVGTLAASLLGGYLADLIGRRKTIVVSMFSVAVVMLCLSQARSLPWIVIWAGLAGLTGELYRPASSALLADLVPEGQRVTAFATYRVFLNAGWAFGPTTAGLLAKSSFFWLFVGDAATSVLFGLVAWAALPARSNAKPEKNGLGETWKVLRTDYRFRRVLISSLIIGLVFVQVFSTMSLQITHSGFSPSVYGMVISLNGVLIVLCELPLTTVTRRFDPRRMMALGYLLIGAGFASNLLARSLPLLIVTVVVFSLGEMISLPLSGAYVADLAPPHQRGLYMGAYGLMWALAFIFGPSLGLSLFAINPVCLWTLCGIFGLVAAGMILRPLSPQPQSILTAGPGLVKT